MIYQNKKKSSHQRETVNLSHNEIIKCQKNQQKKQFSSEKKKQVSRFYLELY